MRKILPNKPLFSLLLLCLNALISAQTTMQPSAQIKPDWTEGEGFQTEYYDYYVGIGVSNDESKARENARNDALRKIAFKIDGTIDVNSISETSEKSEENGKNEIFIRTFTVKVTINETSKPVTISGLRNVDSYYQKHLLTYKYWILIRKPLKTPDPDLKSFTNSKGHIWRSVIFPGWGQLHMGDKCKGTILISTTLVLIAGLATSETIYQNNWNDYLNSLKVGDNNASEVYKSNADTWYLIRNINGVALGGVYIYNLIDVFTKKGTKVFSIKNKPVNVYPAYCWDTALITIRIKL